MDKEILEDIITVVGIVVLLLLPSVADWLDRH